MNLNLPKAHRFVLITDETVGALYADFILENVQGKQVDVLTIPAGEASKTRATKEKLEDQMLALGCTRDTCILALGGGVVGDLAGFTAATFMRGIPFVQIPTTLLAMVDSSIGGKTGVDTPHGKNLIGAIWQPHSIALHLPFLQSLPDEELRNGLVELAKIFMTHDAQAFAQLEQNLDAFLAKNLAVMQPLIERGIELKTQITQRDERESGERATLNFGHTVGHALEHASNYTLKHGFAVALGILVEARLAHEQTGLPLADLNRIEAFIDRLGIDRAPLTTYSMDELWPLMLVDKKTSQAQPQVVLLSSLGLVAHNGKGWTFPLTTSFKGW